MSSSNSEGKKSVTVRTTCSKTGGFKKYTKLPSRLQISQISSLISADLEVKIINPGFIFNRETIWERLPLYFSPLKGILFIYMTEEHGYGLKIDNAKEVTFEGERDIRGCGSGKYIDYKAVLRIVYNFGEVRIRFKEHDNLRSWKTLLLAAHQSPTTLSTMCLDVSFYLKILRLFSNLFILTKFLSVIKI